jgi:hypothetical protein
MTEPGAPGGPGGYTPPPPYGRPDQSAPVPPPYGYPPPGYGYPGYGYPPPGYGYAPAPPRPRLSFGVVAVSVAGLGFLLLVISLLGLPWFSIGDGLTTSDVRGVLADQGDLANDLSVSYFSWFSWALVLMSAGCAVVAALPRAGLSLAFRIAGPIVAGFAVLFTLGAMELTNSVYLNDIDSTYYFEHLGTGFWVALVGFVLIGAGCIVGPRRHQDGAAPGAGSHPFPPGTFQQ